ncbi:MAG TPA: D-2-hydroxyacid dehydrogenase [Urbifossiella sp.]
MMFDDVQKLAEPLMKLVIHPPVESGRLEQIVAATEPMTVLNAANEQQALRHMPDADAFFGKITPALIAAASKLRWVQAPTASLEHYLFPELAAHPCLLTNMRGLFSDVIADQVMGYIICFARNLQVYVLQAAEGRWAPVGGEAARVGFALGPGTINSIDRAHRHLADATLGIVGLGAIGREIARRAAAFGMRIVAVDPQPMDCPPEVAALWPVEELPRLLEQSDYVVVAAPHTPQTASMFRRPQFQKMKRDAHFINIGRGAIVVLDDLVAALEANEIAGAALDVFETEPLPPEHPLWRMPGRVILTPHVAGYSPRIAGRHLETLLDNIGRFVRGGPLRNVVDKEKWY